MDGYKVLLEARAANYRPRSKLVAALLAEGEAKRHFRLGLYL